MKKQILFFAVAALALASCSSENDVVQSPDVQQVTADDGAVLFEAYTQRGVTRAGEIGTLTTDGMKSGAFKDDGFGVFGYYTDNNTYDKLYLPNFMYNEKVTWDDTKWTYEPVKYWPNEYGSTAISDDQDKVSFFAYAPYVLVSPATGKVVNAEGDEFKQDESAELQKWGITSMTRNTATGDPLIKYLVSFDPAHSVDLCWGVCDEDVWTKVVDGGNQIFEKGKPWIDVQRPANAVDQKLKFTFKHATSQLNVQVDAFVDGTDNTNPIADGSKVYIRSITFEGFATQGTLNLNNNDVNPNQAYWLDYAGTNDLVTGETVTIYDGRKDGKEGTIGGEATNEKVLGLNPQLIQSDLWSKNTTTGVTNTSVNLFRKWDKTEGKYVAAGLLEPIYVIPTGDAVKVTIVYDIETADGKLATYLSDAETNGSSIPNTISKTINFGNSTTFENGKSYTIKLHLGLNSVKFDATVSDWVEAGGWSHTDLPSNVPVYTATNASPTSTVTIAADQTTYQYAVSGLTANEAVEGTFNTPVTATTITNGTANSSGVALVTATITANTTVKEVTTGWSKAKGATNSYQINFTQKAAPLGLKAIAAHGAFIILEATATGTPFDDVTTADKIKVQKNGVALEYLSGGATPTATQFKFNTANGVLTLGSNIVPGDVYTITIQAGAASEETITYVAAGDVVSNGTYTLNVPAGATAASVDIVGLKYGTNATVNHSGCTFATADATITPNEATVGTLNLTLVPNTTAYTTQSGTVTVTSESYTTTITIKQAPCPIGLTNVKWVPASNWFDFTWSCSITGPGNFDTVVVKKNGNTLTKDTDYTCSSSYKHISPAGGLTVSAGDKFEFIFTEGEVTESISYTIPTAAP